MAKRPYMILIASQKGGVGKTTFALNLAVALIFQGFSVLFVDSDVESASASEQLGIKVEGNGFEDALRGNVDIEDTLFAYQPINLYILPATQSKELVFTKPEVYEKLYAKLARLDYNFVIVDSAPGLFTREIIKYFNETAIITTPDPVSASGSKNMAAYCEKFRLRHRLIINRVGYSKFDLPSENVERLYGDVAFETIPDDKIITESIMKRKPAYMIDRYSPFSVAIDDLAKAYALKAGTGTETREFETERRTQQGLFSRIGGWLFGVKK